MIRVVELSYFTFAALKANTTPFLVSAGPTTIRLEDCGFIFGKVHFTLTLTSIKFYCHEDYFFDIYHDLNKLGGFFLLEGNRSCNKKKVVSLKMKCGL